MREVIMNTTMGLVDAAKSNSGLYPLFQPRMLRLGRRMNWEKIIGTIGGGAGLGILVYSVLKLLTR